MSKIRKAIAAFLTAAAGAALSTVGAGGMPTDVVGWLALLGTAVGIGFGAALAVYGVPNATASGDAVKLRSGRAPY